MAIWLSQFDWPDVFANQESSMPLKRDTVGFDEFPTMGILIIQGLSEVCNLCFTNILCICLIFLETKIGRVKKKGFFE